MSWLTLGKITKAIGLKGQVRVFSDSDFVSERFKKNQVLRLTKEKDEKFLTVSNASFVDQLGLVQFKEITNRNDAEKLRDYQVSIHKDKLSSLDKDEYYFFDLVGCNVYDLDDNLVGQVKEVIDQPANQVLRISDDEIEFLVAFVKAFVKEVDIEQRKIVIEIVEGMR